MKKEIIISPSILSADFGHLADEAKRIEEAGADWIHVDIMDGLFVPNLTFGPKVVSAIKKAVTIPLDVHIMIYRPFDYVESFIGAGASTLTFHFEATEDVLETIHFIKKCNAKAGLAFCPETSAELIIPFIQEIDLLLLMTVHPGFGGQEFMDEVLDKIQFASSLRDQQKAPFRLEVDGGITPKTAKRCREFGADTFVSGSYIFDSQDMAKAIKELRNGER